MKPLHTADLVAVIALAMSLVPAVNGPATAATHGTAEEARTGAAAGTSEAVAAVGVDYASQIAPIFTRCTPCHGGLMGWYFEDYESIESSAIGQPATTGVTELARFDADDSYLIWKIEGRPEITGVQMPLGGELTQEQIDLMTDWINEGILEVPDTTPPDFAGVTGAAPTGVGRIRIDWAPATDFAGWTTTGEPINTPASRVSYTVYESSGAPVSDFTTPAYVALPGSTSLTLSGLAASTTYYYVVRAVDLANNTDSNVVQADATTSMAGVDLHDLRMFVDCLGGPDSLPDPAPPTSQEECRATADFDGESDVDLFDFAVFQRAFTTLADTTPPNFTGAADAVYVDGVGIHIWWDSADDLDTAEGDIVYDLYRAESPGGQDFSSDPTFTSTPGALFFDDTTVAEGMTYHYVVRARDESGNSDANTIEVSASTPAPDLSAPTFGGIASAVASGTGSITLGWIAADDDVSAPTAIIFNVYRAPNPAGQDFTAPSYTTVAGATEFEVTGLAPNTTHYFVVRAQDEAGNEEGNTVELSATTDAVPPGTFVRHPTMERICSQCHGVKIVLDDGLVGEITPPGQGLAFFPPGFFMECGVRSGQAWQDTVSRMRNQNACPMTDAEQEQIVTFLSENYTGGDPRAATFTRICSTCHTPAVTIWVPRSALDWERTVDRMIQRYDAPAGPQDRTDIIEYLGDVAVGEPPDELPEPEARIYMNLVCSTCHSPKRVIDDDSGLPDSDYRDFNEALELTEKMTSKGCGLRGTTDWIIARWLSTVLSPTPDLVNIDRYEYDHEHSELRVRAWSSTGGSASLTLRGDGGLQTPMTHEGDGEYRVRLQGVAAFPGRITITSTDDGALKWHRKLDDVTEDDSGK